MTRAPADTLRFDPDRPELRSHDAYARIAELGSDELEKLTERLELRAANPQQQAMRREYLSAVELPESARVIEIGCGTGAMIRELAGRPEVSEAVGIDPSPHFLQHAERLAAGVECLSFELGDGRDLPVASDGFDLAVFHTTLCHVPGPELALAEARRVLRPGGWLAIFDGDYATTTVATSDHDPLQSCVEAAIAQLVHDRWLMRRIRTLVAAAGFEVGPLRSHGYCESADPHYMLALTEAGADTLAQSGAVDRLAADALKSEARLRAESGRFFGHIAYCSLVARAPDQP